ncbi:nSTAND1 domain-containing NTPase [Streptomyces sp. LZ34]
MAGRPESPLDPSAGPVARLAAELRKLRAEAGSPTYRVMAQRTGQGASTLSQAAGGERLPTLPVVLAYVRACGGDEEEWEARWREAAAEAAAEPRTESEAAPPYRGLARFEPADADLYFGRDQLTDRLLELTRSRRFTAVFGPSGSGKSSLLRAGLIPRLRTPDPAGPQPAALRVLTPGEHPLRTHEQRLTPKDGDGDTWLIVDQFEELYTLCHDPDERDQFIDRLLTATDPGSRLRVVIAVRADFLGRCAEHPQLTAALQDGTVLAGPMSSDELRQAIVKPAQAAGLIVERGLTTRILDEVEGEPGALPLMSHALLETWRRRKGRALTLEAYESLGGLHGAITRTAEDIYDRLTPAQADLARRILLRLVTPGDGAPDTRRPARREDQQAAVAPYRDRDHTAWMAEHQLERAYRDRFTRAQHADDALQHLFDHAHETATTQQEEVSAWFIAVACPERPLPRTAARMTRQDATAIVMAARDRIDQQAESRTTPGPLTGLQVVTSNPRPGLRCWVLNTLSLRAGRGIYAELHHDGTVLLAANLSWQALRNNQRADELASLGVLVHQDYLGACCRDVCALTSELARHLRLDSGLLLNAAIAAGTSKNVPLIPVVVDFPGFTDVPDHARHPHKIQPVTTTLLPADGDQALKESAQELFTDLMNQFGLDPQL